MRTSCHESGEIAHYSKLRSGSPIPETRRTEVLEDFRYLHLRVRRSAPSETRIRELLFADVSGEVFARMSGSVDECRGITALSRADRLLVLLDAKRLLDPLERDLAIAEVGTLCRVCLDSGALVPCVPIEILVSKWDAVVQAEKTEEVLARIESAKETLQKQLRSHPVSPEWHEIAARPDDSTVLPKCYNLEPLVTRWFSSARVSRSDRLIPRLSENELNEMERFANAAAVRVREITSGS